MESRITVKREQITDDKIADTERKIAQLPVDKRIWMDGFMEGIIRAGGQAGKPATAGK